MLGKNIHYLHGLSHGLHVDEYVAVDPGLLSKFNASSKYPGLHKILVRLSRHIYVPYGHVIHVLFCWKYPYRQTKHSFYVLQLAQLFVHLAQLPDNALNDPVGQNKHPFPPHVISG
jgi:hypothetical protein